MKPFDIIGTLRTECTARDWHLLAGENWYQNYGADKALYDGGNYLMLAFLNSKPNYSKYSHLDSIQYSGIIALGRKFEFNSKQSKSSLKETFIEKYDNRLLCLTTEFDSFIRELSCANELTIDSIELKNDLNKFDANLDFIAATINITHEL